MDGQHFVSHIKEGDRVNAGDLLLEFDIAQIKAAGYATVTPIIVTNSANYQQVQPVKAEGEVNAQDSLLSLYGTK